MRYQTLPPAANSAIAMSLLPRFVVFRTNGGYLSVPANLPTSLPLGFVKFVEPNIWNPRVKFAVEPAQSGDGQLVHIRSCYNNKYLVPQEVQTNNWLVAAGNKPEEDRSKASCTLFEPWRNVEGTNVGLRYIRTWISATYWSSGGGDWVFSSDTQHGLVLSEKADHNFAMLTVIDWETLVVLPSQVIFRSEELDGNYLCSRVIDRWYNYQMFDSGLDVADPLLAKDLIPTPDGNYRIRDLHFRKFWRRSPDWIWADAEENDNSNDTLFSFVKISDNVLALRNLGNNNFCGALTREGKTNCLNAQYPTLLRQTRLIVEERILERSISDIRYRLSDSRIYEEMIQDVSHAFATNNNHVNDSSMTLTYSLSNSRTSHWSNSVSMKFGVKVKFETTIIPIIAKSEVEVFTEVGNVYQWGESTTTVHTRQSSYIVTVPPLTTIKVTLICTRAACDVPFSYTQRDLLTTGERVTTLKKDGIYTGINSFDFQFQSSEVTNDVEGRMFVA